MSVPDDDYGVGLDVFYDAPGEVGIGRLGCRRAAARNAHRLVDTLGGRVGILHEHAAVDADILFARLAVAGHVDLDKTQILLRREDIQRLGRE